MKNSIDSNFAIAILALVATCMGFAFWLNINSFGEEFEQHQVVEVRQERPKDTRSSEALTPKDINPPGATPLAADVQGINPPTIQADTPPQTGTDGVAVTKDAENSQSNGLKKYSFKAYDEVSFSYPEDWEIAEYKHWPTETGPGTESITILESSNASGDATLGYSVDDIGMGLTCQYLGGEIGTDYVKGGTDKTERDREEFVENGRNGQFVQDFYDVTSKEFFGGDNYKAFRFTESLHSPITLWSPFTEESATTDYSERVRYSFLVKNQYTCYSSYSVNDASYENQERLNAFDAIMKSLTFGEK